MLPKEKFLFVTLTFKSTLLESLLVIKPVDFGTTVDRQRKKMHEM